MTRAAEFKVGPFEPAGAGVAPLGGDAWRALSADPQFVFPAPPKGAKRLVLFLEAGRDGALTPRIYFSWGGGFSQDDSFGCEPARAALIRLDLDHCPDLRGLRLDPFEGAGEFTLRWGVDAEGEALARAVAPALAALEAKRAPVLRADVAAADFAPALRERPFGIARKPHSAHEHFLHACALARRELQGRFEQAPATPLISFVSPLFNTPAHYLDDLIASFRRQPRGYAELVLSDDGSTSAETAKWLAAHGDEPGLVVLRNGVNRGIAAASNAGVAASRGQWIAFIDHDDALAPHAVGVIARAIAHNPSARFFYTDELIADRHLRGLDFFDKPAFDDVLLSGVNYINHLSIYARDLIEAVGAFREGYDGSQDYDLLLRALKRLKRDEVRHIPYPAYIWRRDGRSYSVKFIEKATANARRALAEAYGDDGAAQVDPAVLPDLHRVRLDIGAPKPKVSIVVPNRDAFRLLSVLTDGLFGDTHYRDFELIVVDNGSTDADTLALYERLRGRPNFVLDVEPADFNFSRQVNRGVALAKGEAILLLNNDIEVISPDWLTEMVGCLAYPDVGIVGARLLYPSGELQHAGVAIGLGGLAGHWYWRRPADFPGPMGRLAVRSAPSAVTGACMLISRACLNAVGPFDETHFAVAYNDVDYCLRARAAGFRTLYTPFATLIHHESATRGRDDRGPNWPRFLRDQAALVERHATDVWLDPALSPWRDRNSAEPQRIALDALPPAR
ncbi:MAG: glycosyltransferase family 2 protein [Pseudomonadota bacterium]|nr:glycosyltransferase family 2 protein [Pseudomonadota bacterium]